MAKRDVSLGTGMLEKAKRALQGRKRNLDRQIDQQTNPKKKKKRN